MIDWIGESETTIDEHEKRFNTKQYVDQRIHVSLLTNSVLS